MSAEIFGPRFALAGAIMRLAILFLLRFQKATSYFTVPMLQTDIVTRNYL